MKFHFFPIALLFFFAFSIKIHAQIDKKVKISLKNGVKIKGGIVESFDDSLLKVKIDDSTTFIIRYDIIAKISFKDFGNVHSDFNEKLSNPPSLKTESFYHEIRGGLLFGEENVNVSLQTINGYQFNKYLGTGLGLGFNKFGNYTT
ncbi:MAG: hypothetical protein KAQ79_21960, partial [Cyclobacteriaceae bacterium]|nr:hypothetical protein [Cyclobacteriaceae bacterium]